MSFSELESSKEACLPFHPCVNEEAHGKVARIHIPIAPLCNIQCAYSRRVFDAVPGLQAGPGSTSEILSVDETVTEAENFLTEWGDDSIIGITVKINMVFVPHINGAQAEAIAEQAASFGVAIINPVPLLPRGELRSSLKPDINYMKNLREVCSGHLPVFTKCKQYSADAKGIPGKEVSFAG
ncbi:hypothetical protein [Maridesulfovibrio sp.]|uniref:hypothetical protein n=1 Tax=Maridesulfovibrio sp. TaxID=2795000 RepID=UPI002AA60D22|nr:hypothetical protein [Maridesulfovibrio sp.]